jgi:hypothetical protein
VRRRRNNNANRKRGSRREQKTSEKEEERGGKQKGKRGKEEFLGRAQGRGKSEIVGWVGGEKQIKARKGISLSIFHMVGTRSCEPSGTSVSIFVWALTYFIEAIRVASRSGVFLSKDWLHKIFVIFIDLRRRRMVFKYHKT